MCHGAIILLITVFAFLLLTNVDVDFSNLQMPIVYVVKNNFFELSKFYNVVILIAIFTTAISAGMSFLNNVCKNKKYFKIVSITMCLLSIAITPFSFAKLIEIFFPLFGYIGLIQIYFIAKH